MRRMVAATTLLLVLGVASPVPAQKVSLWGGGGSTQIINQPIDTSTSIAPPSMPGGSSSRLGGFFSRWHWPTFGSKNNYPTPMPGTQYSTVQKRASILSPKE